jgi:hypothetical protein
MTLDTLYKLRACPALMDGPTAIVIAPDGSPLSAPWAIISELLVGMPISDPRHKRGRDWLNANREHQRPAARNTIKTDMITDSDLKTDSPDVPGCPAIFVIVHVFYGCYRFQDNLGAATDFETAKAFAEQESTERGSRGEPLPIMESPAESFAMDSSEIRHIWIEVFSPNTTP